MTSSVSKSLWKCVPVAVHWLFNDAGRPWPSCRDGWWVQHMQWPQGLLTAAGWDTLGWWLLFSVQRQRQRQVGSHRPSLFTKGSDWPSSVCPRAHVPACRGCTSLSDHRYRKLILRCLLFLGVKEGKSWGERCPCRTWAKPWKFK